MNVATRASERRGSREVAHEEVPAGRSFAADAMAGATSAATAPLSFLTCAMAPQKKLLKEQKAAHHF